MTVLTISIYAAMVSSLLLTLVFVYLFVTEKKSFLGTWTASWLLYSFRFIFKLSSLYHADVAIWEILMQTSAMVSGLLLLVGVYQFTQRPAPRWLAPIGILGFAWILVSQLNSLDPMLESLPTFVLLGLVFCWTGASILFSRQFEGLWKSVLGWTFIVWGIHKFNYPILAPNQDLAFAGYLLGSALAMLVAMGLLLSYFEQARQGLVQSEEKLRLLATSVEDIFWIANADWSEMIYCSPSYERVTGRSVDNIYRYPRSWFEEVHDEDRNLLLVALQKVATNETPDMMTLEYRYTTADGSVKWLSSASYVTRDHMRRPVRIVGVTRDISSQRSHMDQLQSLIQEKEAILSISNLCLQARDMDEIYRKLPVILSSALDYPWVSVELYNSREEEMVVVGLQSRESGDRRLPIRVPVDMTISGQVARESMAQEFTNVTSHERFATSYLKDLQIQTLLYVPIPGRSSAVGVIGLADPGPRADTSRDMKTLQLVANQLSQEIERKAEAEERARLTSVIENTSEFIGIANLDGQVKYLNKAACRMSGVSLDSGNLFITDFISEELLPLYRDEVIPTLMRDGSWEGEHHIRNIKTMERLQVLIRVFVLKDGVDDEPLAYAAVMTDLTHLRAAEEEQRSLEAQLRHAQKMEAMGRLAGGVAHDFNNLLTSIIGNVSLARLESGVDQELSQYLDEISLATDRAARLTSQLLMFSRRQVLEMKQVSITEILGGLKSMLIRLLGEDVQLTIKLDQDPCRVVGDRDQLEQAIINLAINARDAMPRGGNLELGCSLTDIGRRLYGAGGEEILPGRYISLTIKDSGEGIAPETIGQIFEPFFTTKPAGKGTGLGLAMVYGIVKQHRGGILVESEKYRGTTFNLCFPWDSTYNEENPPSPPRQSPRGGTGTILVVEDDPAVRAVTTNILRRLGYRPIAAEDGSRALQILEQAQTLPDLVLTDVIMPGMNGKQLADRIRADYGNLPIVFISGYTDDVISEHGVLAPDVMFLPKPFTTADLALKLREALEKGGGS